MSTSAFDVAEARWRKSSKSGGGGGAQCVELAYLGAGAAVRDSKNTTGPVCRLDKEALRAFLSEVQAGRLDVPGK